MLKVQKHIKECQIEVKTNIFNEAFSLIHEHAFKHPHDPHDLHSLELHDGVHDDSLHRNLTLTEHEILKFFEENDHFGGHHLDAADSFVPDHPHIDESLPSISPSISPNHDPALHYLPPWHRPYPEHLYKKTDSIRLNMKSPEDSQSSTTGQYATTTNRNPYQYFNINTGEATRKFDRQRRDLHLFKHLHKDHHHSDHHTDSHEHDDGHHAPETIHPTAIDYKDKRIAGVSFTLQCFLFQRI